MAVHKKDIDSRILKVAEKIRELRKAKGFTSYETFAFQYEIDRVQYQRVETGSNITLKTLLRILDIHGLTFEEFFKDSTEFPKTNNNTGI